ncbi:MAG: hypothetical protein R6V30_03165, partial [Paracoccaceae bacterium]
MAGHVVHLSGIDRRGSTPKPPSPADHRVARAQHVVGITVGIDFLVEHFGGRKLDGDAEAGVGTKLQYSQINEQQFSFC